MAPEVTVFVPDGQLDILKEAVATIPGAKIKEIKSSRPADYQEALAETMQRHKERVRSLLDQKKDEKTQTAIQKGYERLIRKVYTATEQKPSIEEFKTRVINIFLMCTQEQPTAIVGGNVNHAQWKGHILQPRQVESIILEFGLDTGNARSREEIGSLLGVKNARATAIVNHSLRLLSQSFS